jgi:hypothetical protein
VQKAANMGRLFFFLVAVEIPVDKSGRTTKEAPFFAAFWQFAL